MWWLKHRPENKPSGPVAATNRNPAIPASDSASEKDFIPLFNGRDLTGWQGTGSHWFVEGGSIVGQDVGTDEIVKTSHLVWTNCLARDFELRFKFKNNNTPFVGVCWRAELWQPYGHYYELDFQGVATGRLRRSFPSPGARGR